MANCRSSGSAWIGATSSTAIRSIHCAWAALAAAMRWLEIDALVGLEQAAEIGPAQRPGRIEDPQQHRDADRHIERVDPPARHRVVELADAIPLMAGGGDPGDMRPSQLSGPSVPSSSRNGMRASSSISLPPARPDRPGDDADEQRHRPDDPELLEDRQQLGHAPRLLQQVFGADGGEIDHPAQDLEIGDQRIHLGEPARAGRRSRRPPPWGSGPAPPSWSPSTEAWATRSALAACDHLVAVGHAHDPLRLQVGLDVGGLQVVLRAGTRKAA